MVSGLGLCCWLRFLPAIAPEDKTDRHRGANRLPVERKTDAETSAREAHGKAKAGQLDEFPQKRASFCGTYRQIAEEMILSDVKPESSVAKKI
jgi:hypothetical protein